MIGFLRGLLTLAFLLVLLRAVGRLLFQARPARGAPPGRGGQAAAAPPPRPSQKLVACSVCGVRVPEEELRALSVSSGVIRICSPECRVSAETARGPHSAGGAAH